MKLLKNVAIYGAGVVSGLVLLAASFAHFTNNPRSEDSVMYEDDDIKLTRVTERKSGDKVGFATITYKDQ